LCREGVGGHWVELLEYANLTWEMNLDTAPDPTVPKPLFSLVWTEWGLLRRSETRQKRGDRRSVLNEPRHRE
jgi:hypothetical protein